LNLFEISKVIYQSSTININYKLVCGVFTIRYDDDGKNVMSRDYSDVAAEKGEPSRYAKLWEFST